MFSTCSGNSISKVGFLYKAFSVLEVSNTILICTSLFGTTVDKFSLPSIIAISALLTGSVKDASFFHTFGVFYAFYVLHRFILINYS